MIRQAEYFELMGLFFIQWMAMSVWFVPLGPILDAYGLGAIKPFAFAASAVSAFVSPLIFGAMADRHVSPVKVLRGLTAATAFTMLVVTWSIKQHWPPGAVLLLIQLLMLCSAPTASICTSIVFARLKNSQREFGPIRATGTFGWMCGCWLVSALNADTSVRAGCAGAVIWLGLAAFTFFLPDVPPPEIAGRITLKQRLGWDALGLLKNPDHRVVFITAALFSIPLAAFFPFTPQHLQQFGFQHTSAWMSLGQVSEIIAMFTLAGFFARLRLKWIFAIGLGFGLLRFSLCALNSKTWLLLGISLHGFSYAFYFITAQIYLDERVDAAWRTRAQALFSLMTSGVGNLAGYLGTGWWFAVCAKNGATQWPLFWGGLVAVVAVVGIYFLTKYRGQENRRIKPELFQSAPILRR
jgi:nucleoside transporter